jgi:dipeptidyl aminopeptidase/acylaminoacyl peptidase
MRRLLRLLALVIVPVVVFAGQAPAPATAKDQLPPLIDRQLFFGDPEISGAQISPDGRFISFLKPYRGERNIYVKGVDEPFEAARPITADERPVPGYFWSRDGKYVLYVQDKGGNENFHVYAVDPTAPPETDTGVPSARDLTPVEGVAAAIYSVPEKTPETMIVGLNDREPAYHDVYRVNIATGERTLLIENTQKVAQYFFDLEGNPRLAMRQDDEGGTEIFRVDGKDLVPIYSCTYEENVYPIRFTKDGSRVYMETDKGSDVDLSRLLLLDPATGKTELVESDPEKQVDFGGAVFNDATDELIATYYIGDRVRVYPRDEQTKKDLELIRKKLPDGEPGIGSATRDWKLQIVSVRRDVDPGSVYLYHRDKGTFDLLYRSRPDLPSESLAPMKAVRYKARDGLEIPGYLTLPKGVEAKNLPTVIYPHGGPWYRDRWGYEPYAQFLANRGYAVLQINFRGSTGYGKHFLNAGNHEWGTGAMQHDITDGVRYLIDRGIADPERIGIFGGSYGGYATLAGVTFTPDLYTCAVPYVAPSNIVTLIESFPAYWRPYLKGTWFKRVGDPEVAADREDMLARSPINFVDRIHVPLLVVHGHNDPRVKQAESDRIVIALRDKGMPVEYLVAPDEGHGFRAPGNRMALAAAMEKFLAAHLGGRYQETMTDETAADLAAISVDVNTVKAPEASAGVDAEAAKTAPLPTGDGASIRPATLQYKASLETAGQKLDLEVSRTVEAASLDGTDCWRITDQAKTPMGNSTDVFEADKRTLLPIHRKAEGMGSMDLRYGARAVTGSMGAGGRTMDVNVALEAPVLGDGPGLSLLLAGLPLTEGYSTTLRIFDSMTQKVRPMKLEVTGTEDTQVTAGTFPTWIVVLTPLDGDEGGTSDMRLMRDLPHHEVRSEVKLPAMMGGGSMTTELEATGSSGE